MMDRAEWTRQIEAEVAELQRDLAETRTTAPERRSKKLCGMLACLRTPRSGCRPTPNAPDSIPSYAGHSLGQLFSAFARQHCPGFRHILQLFPMNLVPDSQSHFAALGSVIFVFRCFSHGRDPNNHGQKNVNPNNRFRRKSTGERRAFISSKFGMLVKYTIPLLTGDLHANGRRLSRFVQCF